MPSISSSASPGPRATGARCRSPAVSRSPTRAISKVPPIRLRDWPRSGRSWTRSPRPSAPPNSSASRTLSTRATRAPCSANLPISPGANWRCAEPLQAGQNDRAMDIIATEYQRLGPPCEPRHGNLAEISYQEGHMQPIISSTKTNGSSLIQQRNEMLHIIVWQ